MLREWLEPGSLPEFLIRRFGREPFARPGSATRSVGLFSWSELDRILDRSHACDILLVRTGRVVERDPPRGLADVRKLFDEGIGFVVRRAETRCAALGALTSAFARDLAGRAKLQLFVTPAATHGFGWHWDSEHVFIAQTAGVKDYYFRRNTVSPSDDHDFAAVGRETSAIGTARLLAGDWLYLPSRWWHVAACREDSLSISIGVCMPQERSPS
jgi:hypothetical protein